MLISAHRPYRPRRTAALIVMAGLLAATPAFAQSTAPATIAPATPNPTLVEVSSSTPESAPFPGPTPDTASLPDAPSTTLGLSADSVYDGAPHPSRYRPPPVASHVDKNIDPGQIAPPLTVPDKVILGIHNALGLRAISGWIVVAGYSHVVNSTPHYGTDSGAFGQRLYASALRGASESIISDSIMSPVFHEDPRYYQLGPGHSILHRAVYAATRTVITRSDSGATTPNYALLTGNLAGASLTNIYYPSRDRSVGQTFETYAGSLGGSALGFLFNEFFLDAVHAVHLK